MNLNILVHPLLNGELNLTDIGINQGLGCNRKSIFYSGLSFKLPKQENWFRRESPYHWRFTVEVREIELHQTCNNFMNTYTIGRMWAKMMFTFRPPRRYLILAA